MSPTERARARWSALEADDRLLAVLAGLGPRGSRAGLAVVRSGSGWIVAIDPEEVVTARGADAFAALDRIDASGAWWAGFLSYDLGRAVERVVPRLIDDLEVPDLCFARFDARLLIDATGMRIEGDGPARGRLEALRRRIVGPASIAPPDLQGWSSSVSGHDYAAAVEVALELIAAGECFQVNLARRLSCPRPAHGPALFASLVRNHPAPHACLMELAQWVVVSGSPERFLGRDGGIVQTRPVKGTGSDPVALAASVKDRAENVMIVDLARNDLGRVCEYASVRVPELYGLEAHPGLFHLVSTVEGRLRPEVGTAPLVAATFPPASVTGAPKPRVLQAIEDLEAVRRNVYCGSVGWIDAATRRLDLNVAIRTFVVAGGATHLGVGAGIVADSDPWAEWRETELKASRLLAAAAPGASLAARAGRGVGSTA